MPPQPLARIRLRRTSDTRRGAAAWDLVDESLAGALARPFRAALTVLGSALGIAALLATVGVTQTGAAQLLSRFDEIASVEVVVTPAGGRQGAAVAELPFHSEDELTRLRGVVAAGTIATVELEGGRIHTLPPTSIAAANDAPALPVVAASAGLGAAVRGSMIHGRWFDRVHDDRAERVVVLGARAAARLQVNRVDHQPVVFIDEAPFLVIGILGEVARETDLLGAVIVPQTTASERFGLEAPQRVVIETVPGAARLIGEQSLLALSPNDPGLLQAEVPPEFESLRRGARSDANALYLILGAVSLIGGAVGIANITLVSVFERIGEIGLRRALGATRRSVAGQFLVESGVLGLIGGLVGSAAGVLIVVATALVRAWTPVLDLRLGLLGPIIGLAVGLAAGAYPAWRAGAIEPVEALRSGV